jgi:hypothetical protein
MKNIRPDFEKEKINMFEEVELPADLKGLIIDSIKKEKRKKLYKEITAAAAVILLVIVPGYFYLSYDNSHSNNDKNIAINSKKSSDAYTKTKNSKKIESNIKVGSVEKSQSNELQLNPAKQEKGKDNSSNSSLADGNGESKVTARPNSNLNSASVAMENIKQDKSDKKVVTYRKENLNQSKKSHIQSNKNEKNNIYKGEVAINQNANNPVKSGSQLPKAESSGDGDLLKNNNAAGENPADKSSLKIDDKQTFNAEKSTDGKKSTENTSAVKTPNTNEIALAKTGDSENAINNSTDANTQDKSDLKMSVMAKAADIKPVITINFDLDVDMQEVEKIINQMNVKDYAVKDNQIEINCNITEYESIKNSIDETYKDKVKYVEPENFDKDQNAQVKLIIQF